MAAQSEVAFVWLVSERDKDLHELFLHDWPLETMYKTAQTSCYLLQRQKLYALRSHFSEQEVTVTLAE